MPGLQCELSLQKNKLLVDEVEVQRSCQGEMTLKVILKIVQNVEDGQLFYS